MEKLVIYEFQAKQIEDALRLVIKNFGCNQKRTCLDRDVMQAHAMIQNVLNKDINKHVSRF